MINKEFPIKKIPIKQLPSLISASKPHIKKFYSELLSNHGVSYDDTHMFVNIQDINERFLNLTRLSVEIIPDAFSISTSDHEAMIARKSIPLSYDHDMLVHILPILELGYDCTKMFDLLEEIKSPDIRSWSFEISSLFAFMIIENRVESVTTGIKEVFETLMGYGLRKIHRYGPEGILEFTTYMQKSMEIMLNQDSQRESLTKAA
jgi:hypothetical protein